MGSSFSTRDANRRLRNRLPLALFLLVLFCVLLEGRLRLESTLQKLKPGTPAFDWFREQKLEEEDITLIRDTRQEERGRLAGRLLLQRTFSEKIPLQIWEEQTAWQAYQAFCDALWQDVQYFPVPENSSDASCTVTYQDSWMSERTYGGKRGHEGTDLMASKDIPGLFPVLSMTDGTVSGLGWLEKGGWRIGIKAPLGGYFYYAHLDSYADLKEGDPVRAGQVIGYMGNSGYGPEGTTGMFATHLHLGIYLYPDGVETSVNPYWILRMIEEKKLSCSF